MSPRVIILDRDGTINVDYGYVGRIEDWQFLPGAVAALRLFQHAGWTLAVVTNQSGVAIGRYGIEDVENLHHDVMDERQLDHWRQTFGRCIRTKFGYRNRSADQPLLDRADACRAAHLRRRFAA